MILIDALFINNSGGKILLDYLITELNKEDDICIHYLLDKRILNNHNVIDNGTFQYLEAKWFKRYLFYKKNKKVYSKIFCLANLPPNIKNNIITYTYFHQKLYLKIEDEIPFKNKLIFLFKIFILNIIKNNTNFWIVQTNNVKNQLIKKYNINENNIYTLPFYPNTKKFNCQTARSFHFLYVSNGEPHKNHLRLIESFIIFYDKFKVGDLHLTIDKAYVQLYHLIENLNKKGYPIFNHGYLRKEELIDLYSNSRICFYPSLSESFGLSIIEAIEYGCQIVGADMPYLYDICKPSLTFNPKSIDEIVDAFTKTFFNFHNKSQLLVENKIHEIINILKT